MRPLQPPHPVSASLGSTFRYKLRRPVMIDDVSEDQRVWVAPGRVEKEEGRPLHASALPTGSPPRGTSGGEAQALLTTLCKGLNV